MRRKLAAGFAAAAVAAATAWFGLAQRPAEKADALVRFELPMLHPPERKFSAHSMLGRTWILNVWASWCAPCVAEHPVVSELANHAPVVGVDYMDRREEAIAWLRRYGNPFRTALFDGDGQLGVKGVPATFVVDKGGAIRYRHLGPVTPELMAQKILPLLRELERQ